MKVFLVFLLAIFSLNANAQIGFSGGGSIIQGFGVSKAYKGIHIGVEVPREDMISFFGRMTYGFPLTYTDTLIASAYDPVNTHPSVLYSTNDFRSSYFSIAAGTRYYIGNGYDYGLSAYGGSTFEISTVGVNRQSRGDIDDSKYQFISSDGNIIGDKGRKLGFGLGLSAGVKYHTTYGMFYLDVSGSYKIFNQANNYLAYYYSFDSSLMFSVNVGFRKDLFY